MMGKGAVLGSGPWKISGFGTTHSAKGHYEKNWKREELEQKGGHKFSNK